MEYGILTFCEQEATLTAFMTTFNGIIVKFSLQKKDLHKIKKQKMKRGISELYQDDNLSENDVAYKENYYDTKSPSLTTDFIIHQLSQTTVQSKRKRIETIVNNNNNNSNNNSNSSNKSKHNNHRQQVRITSPFSLDEKCSTFNADCKREPILPLEACSSIPTKDVIALNNKEDVKKIANNNSGAQHWKAYCKNRKKMMLEMRQEHQCSKIILHPSQYLQASMSQGDGPNLMDID
jgi:hypothetical protein